MTHPTLRLRDGYDDTTLSLHDEVVLTHLKEVPRRAWGRITLEEITMAFDGHYFEPK